MYSAEIDITRFWNEGEFFTYSHSIAEGGQSAGPDTWNAALKRAATPPPLLPDEAHVQLLRDHVQAMGFGEEVQDYDATKCEALFIQLIAGDARECGLDKTSTARDWKRYEKDAAEGIVSSNLFKTGRKVYYTLSK